MLKNGLAGESPALDLGESGSGTVVVGVKLDSPSRELLTWALVKVAQPGDLVIALHVLGSDGNGKWRTFMKFRTWFLFFNIFKFYFWVLMECVIEWFSFFVNWINMCRNCGSKWEVISAFACQSLWLCSWCLWRFLQPQTGSVSLLLGFVLFIHGILL